MVHFFSMVKSTALFIFKYIWVILLFFVIGYLVYQNSFSWEAKEVKSASNELKSNEDVIFLVVEEQFSGVKGNGFQSLSDSLKTWEYDKKNQKMYVKFEKLLPYSYVGEGKDREISFDNTKVMVLYDRGFDSFERYSEVVSVSTLPYQYFFKGEPLITIESIHEDGTVFIEFKGKKIQLNAGDKKSDTFIEGFQLGKTVIKNHGIYKKTHFLPMEENETVIKTKEKSKAKNNKTNDESGNSIENTNEAINEKKVELPNIHE